MTDTVSADTEDMASFVQRGAAYLAGLQQIHAGVASQRAATTAALGHGPVSLVDRPFAELMAEAAGNNLFVELVQEALEAYQGPGPLGRVPADFVDRALVSAGHNPTGRDVVLSGDIGAIEAAIAEALSDGDLVEVRRLRDLRALAFVADGSLTNDQQDAYDDMISRSVPSYAAWLLSTMTPEEVVAQLRDDVYAEAGIVAWDPSLGVDFNTATIDAVYQYYPQLYGLDPNMQWVGLASIAAPQFYAGFLDIEYARQVAETGGDIAEVLPTLNVPSWLAAELASLTADELAEALWFMETKFLSMQRQIFDDMAVQHYAFQVGGLDLVQGFAEGTPVNGRPPTRDAIDRTMAPWVLFEAGAIDESTGLLVDREQRDIIQDDYSQIWDHSPAAKLFVTGAGFTAVDPSGGPSFFDHVITPDWKELEVNIPDFTGKTPDIPSIETAPLEIGRVGGVPIRWDPPDFGGIGIPDLPSFETWDIDIDIDRLDLTANVANEEDRMRWIEEVVNAMVIDRWHNDPEGLMEQVQLDLHAEVESYRQIPAWLR